MVSNSAGLEVRGCAVVISTPPLFGIAFSPSPSVCAVCDVGFGNNKWLDVFRCHVKPRDGHVLSEHTTTAGGFWAPRSGSWVRTVCVEAPDSSGMGTLPG